MENQTPSNSDDMRINQIIFQDYVLKELFHYRQLQVYNARFAKAQTMRSLAKILAVLSLYAKNHPSRTFLFSLIGLNDRSEQTLPLLNYNFRKWTAILTRQIVDIHHADISKSTIVAQLLGPKRYPGLVMDGPYQRLTIAEVRNALGLQSIIQIEQILNAPLKCLILLKTLNACGYGANPYFQAFFYKKAGKSLTLDEWQEKYNAVPVIDVGVRPLSIMQDRIANYLDIPYEETPRPNPEPESRLNDLEMARIKEQVTRLRASTNKQKRPRSYFPEIEDRLAYCFGHEKQQWTLQRNIPGLDDLQADGLIELWELVKTQHEKRRKLAQDESNN